jgi:hypothetical protein
VLCLDKKKNRNMRRRWEVHWGEEKWGAGPSVGGGWATFGLGLGLDAD